MSASQPALLRHRPERLTRARVHEAVAALGACDPALAWWIERIGPISLRRQRAAFPSLCRTIVSQQVSARAAATIHRRFLALSGGASPTPAGVLALGVSELREAGVSGRKASYLHALAEAFLSGQIQPRRYPRLSDAEIVEELIQVPGIGRWSAEMFLIFVLGRPDVFSSRDLALCAGVRRLARSVELSTSEIERRAERWAPWRSVASLYLWKIAHYPETDSVA